MSINTAVSLIMLLVIHWMADFGLQTEAQENKYKSFPALLKHTGTYSPCMIFAGYVFFAPTGMIMMAAVCLLHLIIDFFSSKIIHKLSEEGKHHDFLVALGADQLLHTITIIVAVYFSSVLM